MWQSLMFRMTYRCSYCMAVCPAGEDLAVGYRQNKRQHVEKILNPLKDRKEPVYVTAGSKAEDKAKGNPNKEVRIVTGLGRTPSKTGGKGSQS